MRGMLFAVRCLFSLCCNSSFDVVHHYSRILCMMKILMCCMRIVLFWDSLFGLTRV